MRFGWKIAALGLLATLCLGGAGLATARTTKSSAPPAPPTHPKKSNCDLGAEKGAGKNIKHVIYLQFDNTHYNRDNPDVESDLERMPHLLNFLTQNGTLFSNDHTILISHTAGGILSSLTGLYPDRQGQTVSNSYDYFLPNGNPTFSSSFKYWTNAVDPTNDPLPNMITDGKKTTPAPWVPFTEAGCDVGGVGTANIELENAGTVFTSGPNAGLPDPNGDITRVFGAGSDEFNEAKANSQLGQTDFVGIAIHCSQATDSKCHGSSHAKADPLPDEPGGYDGFQALYGTKYVDPAIADGSACVNDTNGDPITDPLGNCGFPGFDGMFASNTLGYVAAMQESGVNVTYGYISDAHDLHVPNLAGDSYSSSATGPGELAHLQQLKDYDSAFQAFFDDLEHHGINRGNTLFVITVDEGDHFAGGVGIPNETTGTRIYDHRTCANLAACPTNQLGEVNVQMNRLTGTSNYDIHFDDAPAFYVNGQPGRTDSSVRSLEQQLATLKVTDPYNRDSAGVPQMTDVMADMADPIELKALHMINTDPLRTPTFVMFGNPDFFFATGTTFSNACGTGTTTLACVNSGFAWNHGDTQDEIGNTWVGMVGPGIAHSHGHGPHAGDGVDSSTWTDHTNLRPTILSLVGLTDSYVEDGHVLVQALDDDAIPKGLSGSKVDDLEQIDEQLNSPFGEFCQATLHASTKALASTGGTTYDTIENDIQSLTAQRDTLASTIRGALNDAAFNGGTISDAQANGWISQAQSLIAQANALPH